MTPRTRALAAALALGLPLTLPFPALLHAQARNRLLLQDSRVPKRMSVPLHAASLGLSPWGGGAQPVQL